MIRITLNKINYMATQDLNTERQIIQNELDVLNSQIATMQGEIKAQLKALGVKEEDLESTYAATLTQLQEKEREFNELFASYESLKASAVVQQPAQAPAFQQPSQQVPFNQQPLR